MSKAVMISIKPKWCKLIIQGKKTVEVRKTKPKLKTPFKCYIYETKDLYRGSGSCLFHGLDKVIGEFVCDYIEEYSSVQSQIIDCVEYQISLQKSCEDINLSIHEFCSYGNGKPLYGWHISDLVIYDKPKEISEFRKATKKCFYDDLGCAIPNCDDCTECNITKPPQLWCYVEV